RPARSRARGHRVASRGARVRSLAKDAESISLRALADRRVRHGPHAAQARTARSESAAHEPGQCLLPLHRRPAPRARAPRRFPRLALALGRALSGPVRPPRRSRLLLRVARRSQEGAGADPGRVLRDSARASYRGGGVSLLEQYGAVVGTEVIDQLKQLGSKVSKARVVHVNSTRK